MVLFLLQQLHFSESRIFRQLARKRRIMINRIRLIALVSFVAVLFQPLAWPYYPTTQENLVSYSRPAMPVSNPQATAPLAASRTVLARQTFGAAALVIYGGVQTTAEIQVEKSGTQGVEILKSFTVREWSRTDHIQIVTNDSWKIDFASRGYYDALKAGVQSDYEGIVDFHERWSLMQASNGRYAVLINGATWTRNTSRGVQVIQRTGHEYNRYENLREHQYTSNAYKYDANGNVAAQMLFNIYYHANGTADQSVRVIRNGIVILPSGILTGVQILRDRVGMIYKITGRYRNDLTTIDLTQQGKILVNGR